MVDICNEDLYILDPQFEEKDDIDLFSSEQVIAEVVDVNSGGDDEQTETSRVPDSDQTSDSVTVDSLPISSGSESLPPSAQCNGGTNDYLKFSHSSEDSFDVDLSFGLKPSFIDNERLRLKPNLDDLNCHSRNILSIEQNGLSPLPSPSASSIDSPPKSPRRHQKISQNSFTFLLNQLIMAAQTGDLTLLKQLHHKGVNLMMIDKNGMISFETSIFFF